MHQPKSTEPSGWLKTDIDNWLAFRIEASRGDSCADYRDYLEQHKTDKPDYRTESVLRMPEVLRRVGLSRSALWRRIAVGQFPRPIKLGAISNAA